MGPVEIVHGIGGLLWTGLGIVFVLFVNFLIRRSNPEGIFGIPLPGQWVHAALGPILVAVNGALLVFFCALFQTPVDDAKLGEIRTAQIKWVLGPFCNPFYVGSNSFLNGCGYAFLIVLWWVGMHTFLYSIGLNPESRWLFGWQALISVVYLALGLASMLAIQACWNKFGIDAYRVKWMCGFIGIPIGAFLPPLILRLGVPKVFG